MGKAAPCLGVRIRIMSVGKLMYGNGLIFVWFSFSSWLSLPFIKQHLAPFISLSQSLFFFFSSPSLSFPFSNHHLPPSSPFPQCTFFPLYHFLFPSLTSILPLHLPFQVYLFFAPSITFSSRHYLAPYLPASLYLPSLSHSSHSSRPPFPP